MNRLTYIILALLLSAGAFAQNVGINSDGSAPDASAMLDVKSSNKGFLPPRVYDPAGSISSPAGGLLVYKDDGTADNPAGFYYYNGAAWTRLDDVWTKNAAGINYSGNVGIGTTSPSTQLELEFNTSGTPTYNFFRAGNTSGDNSPQVQFSLENSAVNTFEIFGKTGANSLASKISLNLSNGYVGIGTTTPGAKLHIQGDGSSYLNVAQIIRSTGTTYGPSLRLESTGTGGKTYALYSGQGNDPTGAGIFSIYEDGVGDRLVIKDGNVGIGTTSPLVPLHVGTSVGSFTNPGSPNARYFNEGAELTWSNGFAVFSNVSIYTIGDIITSASFVAASDKRIKTDIKELNNSIDVIKKLKPVQYTKIDKIQNGNKLHYGFIAQEVEEVIPNAVNTGTGIVPILKPFENVSFEDGVEYTILVKNGDDIKEMKYKTGDARPDGEIIVKSKTVNDFKSITYDMIFTVAVDAIQEQQLEIEQLKQKLLEKDQEFNVLKAEVENIKKMMTTQSSLAKIN